MIYVFRCINKTSRNRCREQEISRRLLERVKQTEIKIALAHPYVNDTHESNSPRYDSARLSPHFSNFVP